MSALRRVLALACLLAVCASGRCGLRPELSLAELGAVDLRCVNPDSVAARLGACSLDPIEGIWELTGDGSIVAIERIDSHQRASTREYKIVLIVGADRSVKAGSVMGVVAPASGSKSYDCRIYTAVSPDGKLTAPKTFVLQLSDDGRLKLGEYSDGFSIRPWKLIPYLRRHGVLYKHNRPANLDGMVRVFPPNNSKLRYL